MVALKQGSVPDVIANKLDHLLILTSGTEQYLITCTNKKYKFLLTTTLTISGLKNIDLLHFYLIQHQQMRNPALRYILHCMEIRMRKLIITDFALIRKV